MCEFSRGRLSLSLADCTLLQLSECWLWFLLCVPSLVRSDSLYFSSTFLPVSEGGIPSTAQLSPYNTRPLAMKAVHPKPSNLLWPCKLYFPSSGVFFSFGLSSLSRRRESVGLHLSRRFPSMGQSSGIMFDTVRWPGKLKTQLKWQSRGQLFCISKALLWLFYTHSLR